jgi:hypothetical protein
MCWMLELCCHEWHQPRHAQEPKSCQTNFNLQPVGTVCRQPAGCDPCSIAVQYSTVWHAR